MISYNFFPFLMVNRICILLPTKPMTDLTPKEVIFCKTLPSTTNLTTSAKVSDGMPDDEDEDYEIPVWAGVLPLESAFTTLQGDDRVLEGIEPSATVQNLQGRKL